MHLLALLGLFTDRNDIFPHPFIYLTSETHTLSYTWSLKKLPLLGGATLYRPLYRVLPSNPPEGSVMYSNDKWWFTPSLIYTMPPENCTYESFLHKDLWPEILLANNFPPKRDDYGDCLRNGQLSLFWKLTFPDIWSFFDWLRASISIFVLSKPISMSCKQHLFYYY